MVDACGRESQSPWWQKAKEEETEVLGEGHSVTLRPPTLPLLLKTLPPPNGIHL